MTGANSLAEALERFYCWMFDPTDKTRLSEVRMDAEKALIEAQRPLVISLVKSRREKAHKPD